MISSQFSWSQATPRVSVPTASNQPAIPSRPAPSSSYNPTTVAPRVTYPWKTYITCTVFWIGEAPSQNNPTPNYKSSWDVNWTENFGGFDNPEPSARIADHRTGEFRPKAFTPKLNPFYYALPYNDVASYGVHKPEAQRVIPWFSRLNPKPGQTVCKDRWIQIYANGKSCYAQWEDCGPFNTEDWEYVFGKNQQPKNKSNSSAGIDLSPSVRDYLALSSGQKIHWRFVDDNQVPYGPWKKYGQTSTRSPSSNGTLSEVEYMEYLRRKRDEAFLKNGSHP